MKDSVINAFTVDVEDAVNQAMRNFFNTEMAPTERVCYNTMQILDLLSEYGTLATFFILGEVAETYPQLVTEIARRGHEIGIHGYSHLRYYNLSKEKAREEIVRSIRTVEDITGKKVFGHRAPEFSIDKKTSWVLEILAEEGLKYDSSIFPLNTGRYGWPGYHKKIQWIKLNNGQRIIEAPLSTIGFPEFETPVCGGGYLRTFPYFLTDFAFRQITKTRPVIVYMHPYEIDPPPFQEFYMNAVNEASLLNKIKIKSYWFNRKSVLPKLRRLLTYCKFSTMQNVINLTLNVSLVDL